MSLAYQISLAFLAGMISGFFNRKVDYTAEIEKERQKQHAAWNHLMEISAREDADEAIAKAMKSSRNVNLNP